MEQNTDKDQSQAGPSSKMVSFRMPMAYIQKLHSIAVATGKSKSEVLRSGWDVLQATEAHRWSQRAAQAAQGAQGHSINGNG